MFEATLKALVEGTEGCIAGLVMDANGFTLDSYTASSSEFDVTAVGVEYSVALASIHRAAQMLETGPATEIVITCDKLTTVIRTLGEGYFVALTLHPDGNAGKGRYLMRRAAGVFLRELG